MRVQKGEQKERRSKLTRKFDSIKEARLNTSRPVITAD
jgi:hypothetical protein